MEPWTRCCPQAPRLLDLGLRAELPDWPLLFTVVLETPAAPAVHPLSPRHSVSVSWGPAEARWGRTLAWVRAGRASPRDRRPTFRVLSLLGTAPETVWGESGNPVVPRLGKGHHPSLRKASQASQERCAVNDLGTKTQCLLSPCQCPEQSE